MLLAHVLGIQRIRLYTGFDRPLEPRELDAYRQLVRRRAERMPVAYLTGTKEFHSLAFRVGPEVLVPRPETEHLVDAAIELAKGIEAPRILDVGTGSGCIAVSVLAEVPAARAVATDVSAAALAVAGANATAHGVADRLDLVEGDLFAPVGGRTFDLVLANPPYVARDEKVDPECRAEPDGAVFADPDPVTVYRRLMEGAPAVLAPGAHVLLELPGSRLAEIRAAIPPALAEEKVISDYHGLPRVLWLSTRPR